MISFLWQLTLPLDDFSRARSTSCEQGTVPACFNKLCWGVACSQYTTSYCCILISSLSERGPVNSWNPLPPRRVVINTPCLYLTHRTPTRVFVALFSFWTRPPVV